MKEDSRVSIIMPAHNTERYIKDSIESVIKQNHKLWELIIINDGSTDDTLEVINSFGDKRITVLSQENLGVSAARNRGLKAMQGDFFCFLDADDLMTEESLTSRLKVFRENPEISIVGGAQEQRSEDLTNILLIQRPIFEGYPQKELARLNAGCFINYGTWLIKREPYTIYKFPVGWTHAEDLAFFFSISNNRLLAITSRVVQIYRRSNQSAMTKLVALEKGYWKFFEMVKSSNIVTLKDTKYLKRRIIRIMTLSYLKKYQIKNAVRCLMKSGI